MKSIEISFEHKGESEICEQVIASHKLMISAGHPPYPPVEKDWFVVEEDKWAHLRTPPLILRREFIENWNFINVDLPQHRDEDELTESELIQQAINKNDTQTTPSVDTSKPYNVI